MSDLGNVLPAHDITQSAYRDRYRHADATQVSPAVLAAPGVSWCRRFRRMLLVSDTIVILIAVAASLIVRFSLANPATGLGITPEYAVLAASISHLPTRDLPNGGVSRFWFRTPGRE